MHLLKSLQSNSDNVDNSQLSKKSFKFLKYLDAGSYGKVFQVRKEHGENKNKVYAMKVLCKDRFKSRNKIAQSLRESTVLRSIQHPFIVELVYAFQTKAKLYMVLQYASRGSLDNILDDVICLNEKETAFYAKEIILAIEYIHSCNVIHRDLKPSNILIDESGHIKLTDFGLCIETSSPRSRVYGYCGTLLFMAPEMFRENGYGQEVDWWALGVMLYRMLIGEYPFISSNNTNEIIELITQGVYDLPCGEVSEEADNLIRSLLDIGYKGRLGYKGACEVRNHEFFGNTCWDSVLNCLETPPFTPKTTDYRSVNPFKRLFPRLPVDSKQRRRHKKKNDELFQGFSYTGFNATGVQEESQHFLLTPTVMHWNMQADPLPQIRIKICRPVQTDF